MATMQQQQLEAGAVLNEYEILSPLGAGGMARVFLAEYRGVGGFARRVVIKQNQFREDPRPIDENCNCYTCKHFSRAYLRHLFLANEIAFATLATLHNLQRYLDIMRGIRHAILIGKFPEYLKALRSQAPE